MLVTLLLNVMTVYRLNGLLMKVILGRHVLSGLLLDQQVPPAFLSSGIGGWSHDDLHLLRGKLLLDRCVPSILFDFVEEVS
jgi:hypothetical protein